MKNDWILDVLADLKSFAQTNNLPNLAMQLTETADLAAIELTSAETKVRPSHGDEQQVGLHSGALGLSRRA